MLLPHNTGLELVGDGITVDGLSLQLFPGNGIKVFGKKATFTGWLVQNGLRPTAEVMAACALHAPANSTGGACWKDARCSWDGTLCMARRYGHGLNITESADGCKVGTDGQFGTFPQTMVAMNADKGIQVRL